MFLNKHSHWWNPSVDQIRELCTMLNSHFGISSSTPVDHPFRTGMTPFKAISRTSARSSVNPSLDSTPPSSFEQPFSLASSLVSEDLISGSVHVTFASPLFTECDSKRDSLGHSDSVSSLVQRLALQDAIKIARKKVDLVVSILFFKSESFFNIV
jgi:hypothetical protein